MGEDGEGGGQVHALHLHALRDGDLLADDHKGGCVLYEKRDQVQAMLTGSGKGGC